MDYSFTRPIPPKQLQRLFAQAEWSQTRTLEDTQTLLRNTALHLGAWQADTLVAYARVLTDDRFRAFIEDVIVDEAYRKQGVGSDLLQQLVERLAHVEEIILTCQDGLIPFYEGFGFVRFYQPRMHIVKKG